MLHFAAEEKSEQARRQSLTVEQQVIEALAWVLNGAKGWVAHYQLVLAHNSTIETRWSQRPQQLLQRYYNAEGGLQVLDRLLSGDMSAASSQDEEWLN